jgi:hypothetical protein
MNLNAYCRRIVTSVADLFISFSGFFISTYSAVGQQLNCWI